MTPLAWLFVLAGLVSLEVRMMPAILPAIAASLIACYGAGTVVGSLSLGRLAAVLVERITLAVATCGTGLAVVGRFAARENHWNAAR